MKKRCINWHISRWYVMFRRSDSTLNTLLQYPPSYYFPSDPALAYNSFNAHASLTGNASSQAFVAFFHATGYHDIVPVDQAKAQLYYTFAAQSGDKGAQMALGYRDWTGIGVLEDCGRALQWYEQASYQGERHAIHSRLFIFNWVFCVAMERFLRGPPLGATLPQTATRLSDLVGGVYGPGASVASTGLNTLNPAIKAGIARSVGETWEDVLEYYSVSDSIASLLS
jgi:SEL1 protein